MHCWMQREYLEKLTNKWGKTYKKLELNEIIRKNK